VILSDLLEDLIMEIIHLREMQAMCGGILSHRLLVEELGD
jgi:hypothetical protein